MRRFTSIRFMDKHNVFCDTFGRRATKPLTLCYSSAVVETPAMISGGKEDVLLVYHYGQYKAWEKTVSFETQ